MLTTLLLLVAAWAGVAVAVLALGRLLGRLSSPRAEVPRETARAPEAAAGNVVPLVPRPQNELVARRRAA